MEAEKNNNEEIRVTFRASKDFLKKLKLHCVTNNISIKQYITDLVLKDLDK